MIVPAAGVGKRMEADIPKPYMQLGKHTVLEHTLSCFSGFSGLSEIIVSTSDPFKEQTEEILQRLFPGYVTRVVQGGAERQDSIFNALETVGEEIDLVAVHDAVRPFVSKSAVNNCLDAAFKTGGAILGVPVKDTIKKVGSKNQVLGTPDRSELWQAQTPQIFRRHILLKAYKNARHTGAIGTDDASLVEMAGGEIQVVEASRDNFKLTYPLDFKIAKLLIEEKTQSA